MSRWQDDILRHAVESGLLSRQEADELLAADLDDDELFEAIYSPERIFDPDVRRLDEALRDYVQPWSKHRSYASDVDPPLHKVLDGLPKRYQVTRPLGSGGMGHVFEAFDRDVKRRVAIKVLRVDTSDPRMRISLERECHVLAELKHPGIVTLHNIEMLGDDRHCLVMELVDGLPLDEYADTHQLNIHRRVELLSHVARAVGAAHVAFRVHRDLKPHNILITPDGSPKVIDFGIASVIGDLTESDEPLTAGDPSLTLRTFGTSKYRSPEQEECSKAIDARSDVYSLGVILYELLSGCLPIDQSSDSDSSTQLPCEFEPRPVVPIEDRVDGLPADICALVAKCLSTDRNDRYPNADGLAEDIDRFLSGHSVRAFEEGGTLYSTVKWLRRNRIPASITATAVVVISTTVAVAFVAVSRERNLAVLASHRAEESAVEAGRQREVAEHNATEAQRQRKIAEQNATEAERQRKLADAARIQAERQRDKLISSVQRRALETASRLIQDRRYFQAARAIFDVPRSRWGWECDRISMLANSSPRPTEVICMHDWGIVDLLATRDGQRIISSGHDGRVIAWDASTRDQTVLSDGAWSESRLMWRHATHPLQAEDARAPDCFVRLCWVDNETVVAAASFHGNAVLWDTQTGKRKSLFTHDQPLCSVAATNQGQVLVFGDDQGDLQVYNRTSDQKYSLPLEGGAILDICSLGDNFLCVAHEDGRIDLVDLEERQSIAQVNEPGPVWDLDFSSTTGLLAVGAAHGAVNTYIFDDAKYVLRKDRTYFLPTDENGVARNVHSVHVAPDGSAIYAGDDKGHVVAWDRQSEQVRFVYLDQRANLFSMLGSNVVGTLPLPLRRRVAAIVSTADSRTLFTAGHDTSVKLWTLDPSPASTTLDVGPGASVVFDTVDPTILWAGNRDGNISLWDTISAREMHRLSAHDNAVVQVAGARNVPLVATCASSTIRYWQRHENEIQPAHAPISHDEHLRSIALSPNAKRLAAYDAIDRVSLWDVASGRLIAQHSLQDAGQGHAVTGVLAFNVDGTLLATAGPGQSTWMLDGSTLEVIEKPPIAAGLGATALAWHPRETRVLLGGDTTGRLAAYPRDLVVGTINIVLDHQAISGVDFTPDGRRLAAAARSGRVVIEDPDWIGLTYLAESPHADIAPITQSTFDPTGRRLSLVHGDGHVEILETGDPLIPEVAPQTRRWTTAEFLRVQHTGEFEFRPPSVQLDSQGHAHLLFSKQISSGNVLARVITVAHETDVGIREEIIYDFGPPGYRNASPISRSLALMLDGHRWFATVRRPLPARGEHMAELVLFHGTLPSNSPAPHVEPPIASEPITDAGNHGLDTFLAPAMPKSDKPMALHFSHDGHYLLRTSWQGAKWHTEKLGRQGDGFRMRATIDNDQRLHVAFSPTRFNGDPTPATYVTFDRPSGKELSRAILDHACCDTMPYGIAVDLAGQPVVNYSRPNLDLSKAVIITRFTTDGWQDSLIYRRLHAAAALSNLVCSADGTLSMACFLPGTRQLELVTSTGDTWSRELVWQAPASSQDTPDVIAGLGPVLRLDHQGRPVIILAFRSEHDASVHIFRPAP